MALTFVLIHGGGLESWVWERVTPLLDLPAIAVHRLPPRTNWKTLRLEDCARFVEHQMVEAGSERAIVVAHSIGGVIAHELAVLAAMQQYIAEKLCHDLDEAATRDMLERGTNPEPMSLFFQPTVHLALPDVPCTYVKLTNDRALHPTVQDQMAARIDANVVEVASGHTVMLSRPKELADALKSIANTIIGEKQ
jgi:pimeloyl-ACP methyl ester carboxylesterase